MPDSSPNPRLPVFSPDASPDRAAGLLAGMRVRKKLIFLHTFFSLLLAGILAAAMWPAITRVIEEAEAHESRLALNTVASRVAAARLVGPLDDAAANRLVDTASAELGPGVVVRRAPLNALGLPDALGPLTAPSLKGNAGTARLPDGSIAAVLIDEDRKSGLVSRAVLEDARAAVVRLYIFMTVALLSVYFLIALSLEIFILPRHVYSPIREMLRADRATQEGNRSEELIPAQSMPADELGEIMRSRNRTISALRKHEHDLAVALEQLAAAASDLKRKNHLIETAQRNLADADRLASLGIMSAGLAHELNTPLAVIKGTVEELASREGRSLGESEAALLLRVVGRLERLSESLLDFARVRPPRTAPANISLLLDEAWTLVRLDRDAPGIELVSTLPAGPVLSQTAPSLFPTGGPASEPLLIECDADRMVQVLVNLLRNAVDALAAAAPANGFNPPTPRTPTITVAATITHRDGREWVSLTIADNGPGIDPEILGRLFEPFASTRLDAKGTGLGLAVSEGIIREHGGVLLARNAEPPAHGAIFEITLPMRALQELTISAAGSVQR